MSEAARALGKNVKIGGDSISRVCRGKRHTAYGYKWKFI